MSPDGSYRIQYKSKWKLSYYYYLNYLEGGHLMSSLCTLILVVPYTLYVQGSERILYSNDIRKEDKIVLFYEKIPWTV